MTTTETARRLLVDAAGQALCDSCLAFACSVSLAEMRQVTEELLMSPSFHRGDTCVTCCRTVPAVSYSAKCIHCSRPVRPGEDALEIKGDILHAGCFNTLVAEENRRISSKLSQESRRLIEMAREARRQIRAQRRLPDEAPG
jgi:hypothetical protein